MLVEVVEKQRQDHLDHLAKTRGFCLFSEEIALDHLDHLAKCARFF